MRFGAVAAPFVAVTGVDGTEVATFTLTGLDAESAVVALELYRRQGAWKVRAVGQGYAGGLAELLTDQGLAEARALADGIQAAVAHSHARAVPAPAFGTADTDRAHRHAAAAPDTTGLGDRSGPTPQTTGTYDAPQAGPADPARSGQTAGPAQTGGAGPVDYTHPGRRRTAPPPPPPQAPPAPQGQPAGPVAGDATGWTMDERLYNQVWGMFEDLARTTAAYRSAVDFADSRMEKELDQVLSDPRHRIGGHGEAAREAARARHADLVGQARQVLDRDLAQLQAEADVVEPALPPGVRPLGQPRVARLPGADGDAHGAAGRRSVPARERPAAHTPAAAAAAGARRVDRQRTRRLPRRLVHRLARDAAPGHGDRGGAGRAAARGASGR
ncbi:hypothetical protein GCM10020256_59260 [Streptomyces thermocoprophilus]